ncbi:hypothetical protein E3N88_42847 [Mikania micrantha]|uniref:Retroviral polymerase SH3-like domain-containing protein n=1 Tax=Mikania micrantha TaxID=192012 RepID=A0A5N6LGJ7_9ASTR|nr:hypothetical protein E3N88_42847 [Mikania micrantha]
MFKQTDEVNSEDLPNTSLLLAFNIVYRAHIRVNRMALLNAVIVMLLKQRKPDLSFLRVFGCQCYPHLRAYNKHKLDFRSTSCVFLGYSTTHHGYRCFDTATDRLYIARHGRFNVHSFSFTSIPSNGAPITPCDLPYVSSYPTPPAFFTDSPNHASDNPSSLPTQSHTTQSPPTTTTTSLSQSSSSTPSSPPTQPPSSASDTAIPTAQPPAHKPHIQHHLLVQLSPLLHAPNHLISNPTPNKLHVLIYPLFTLPYPPALPNPIPLPLLTKTLTGNKPWLTNTRLQ